MNTELSPYVNRKKIGTFFDVCYATVNKWVSGIEREISEGRYPQHVIAGKWINLYAVIDYITYKEWLADKSLRKRVPTFDPIPIARLCGQEGMPI